MKKLIILFLLVVAVCPANAQKSVFSLSKNEFLLNGKPFQIIAGEMHPARIPQQYWRHRIQMAKAMGCNTISIYFFWNYFETKDGKFDFKTENRSFTHCTCNINITSH